MKKLLLALLLTACWPLLTRAAVYTISFDPVPQASHYILCKEWSPPVGNTCSGVELYTGLPTLNVRIADTETVWLRVKSEPADPSKVGESQ